MRLIQTLHTKNLSGDVFGGIAAAVATLPLAIAFGVTSGAGAIAGLYGAVFVGLFAALFGGTQAQISGPTGPMTVVMAAIFTHYTSLYADQPEMGGALAFTVVILGGGFQILFGALKIGKYFNTLPNTVVSGFMSGIGIIMILLQLGPLCGYPVANGPINAFKAIPSYLNHPDISALILGALAICVVYLLPTRINRILPAPMLALIVGMLVFVGFFPDAQTRLLGAIPSVLPNPQLPSIELPLLADMLKSALMLAVLGSINSLRTSLVADNITRTYHNPDRELLGQGIGNVAAGLFGGLPGAGANMRTKVNIRSGGTTPLSGIFHAFILLLATLAVGSFAMYIPQAVLAGILVKVGTDLIDWEYLKRIHTAPRPGVIIMLSVLLITVFVDLITVVAIGIIMASLLLMHRVTEMQLKSIIAVTEPSAELPLSEAELKIIERAKGRILLYHMSGPMSFGAAASMVQKLAAFDDYDVLVLDLTDVPVIDYSVSHALEVMVRDTQELGHNVLISGARPNVKSYLKQQGVLAHLKRGHLHSRRMEALQNAAQLLRNGTTKA